MDEQGTNYTLSRGCLIMMIFIATFPSNLSNGLKFAMFGFLFLMFIIFDIRLISKLKEVRKTEEGSR